MKTLHESVADKLEHADILRPTIAETLPVGWESRLQPVPGYDNVFALDPYDLGLVKLMMGRPKDLDLLRALLKNSAAQPQPNLTKRVECVEPAMPARVGRVDWSSSNSSTDVR